MTSHMADEEWILHSINDKWRSWKAFVKARCFIPNMTVELLMDEKEGRVLEDQWVNLVNYWNREDVEVFHAIYLLLMYFIFFFI